MIRALSAALLLTVATLVPAVAAPALPACAGKVEVAGAEVVRVERDGVLVLKDGRAAVLEGVLLPQGAADQAADFYRRAALDQIRQMADGHHVWLVLDRPKEDRYGRLRAQVFFPHEAADGWVQAALLKAGLARVDLAPDRPQCAEALYADEGEARVARAGLWKSPAYAVRTPDSLGGQTGTFQVVEGRIADVRVKDGRAFLNFGDDWNKSLTATIAPEDMDYFRHDGDDPRLYQGARVRLRGWVEKGRGPEIQLAGPGDIQVLPDQAAQK